MTVKESINVLNNHIDHWHRLIDERICTKEEGNETINAFNKALESLKAWNEVKEDIEQQQIYDWIATQSVLDIINKHLKEVEND